MGERRRGAALAACRTRFGCPRARRSLSPASQTRRYRVILLHRRSGKSIKYRLHSACSLLSGSLYSNRCPGNRCGQCSDPVQTKGNEPMRADLRLSDLERKKVPSKLMNVKVPDNVSEGIDRVAEELGCSKTAVVIALLNEGLDASRSVVPARSARNTAPPDTAAPFVTPRSPAARSAARRFGRRRSRGRGERPSRHPHSGPSGARP